MFLCSSTVTCTSGHGREVFKKDVGVQHGGQEVQLGEAKCSESGDRHLLGKSSEGFEIPVGGRGLGAHLAGGEWGTDFQSGMDASGRVWCP